MTRKFLLASLSLFCLVASIAAHDLFLKPDSYFLRPNSTVTVRLLNGSFQNSEGAVKRDRMQDVSIVAPQGEVTHPPASDWRDEGEMSLLTMKTAGEGTYVVGLSTKPREIDLKAKEFNNYLAHDGLPDTLAARRKDNQLGKDVRERYSKHVRAILQVGDARSDNYGRALGYPVEIIPRQNPYDLRVGQILEVLCTLDGQPLVNQFVLANRETKAKRLSREISARTDANGIARFKLTGAGKWYVKMIHIQPSDEPGLNYESKWVTITFEIKP
ncbi:MAG: DUF4198 domain-containing protein [Pyrinomonadaceae bacterium]|nr:DUF4198 domain-containing protein [Pyrinomonadaceae bacterium]